MVATLHALHLLPTIQHNLTQHGLAHTVARVSGGPIGTLTASDAVTAMWRSVRVWRLVGPVIKRPPPNCLDRSVLLMALLHAHNPSPKLNIGIRKHNGTLQAHAWVTVGSQIVGDSAENTQQYTALNEQLTMGNEQSWQWSS